MLIKAAGQFTPPHFTLVFRSSRVNVRFTASVHAHTSSWSYHTSSRYILPNHGLYSKGKAMGAVWWRRNGDYCAPHQRVCLHFCISYFSSHLPEYVFDGDERPRKTSKRKSKVCIFATPHLHRFPSQGKWQKPRKRHVLMPWLRRFCHHLVLRPLLAQPRPPHRTNSSLGVYSHFLVTNTTLELNF